MKRIIFIVCWPFLALCLISCDPCQSQCVGDQVCKRRQCVDPVCADGFVLDPSTHTCVDPCEGISCIGDQTCLAGECIDPVCASHEIVNSLTHVCMPDYENLEDCAAFQGPGDSNFKILFVQINRVDYYDYLVDQIIHDQLAAIDPFNQYYNNIGMYKLSLEIENVETYCNTSSNGLAGSGFACDNSLIKQYIQSKCRNIDPEEFITIAFAESIYGGTGGEIIYVGVNSENPLQTMLGLRENMAIHEIGHNFGLADLYYGTLYFDGRPSQFWPTDFSRSYYNVDGPGCGKWCESFKPVSEYTDSSTSACLNLTSKEACVTHERDASGHCNSSSFPLCCVWSDEPFEYFDTNCVPAIGNEDIGIDCLGDTGCYFGAVYGNYAWRPVLNGNDSLMYSLNAASFDDVSSRHLKQVMDCCYMQNDSVFCQDFKSGFNEFLRNNPFKKKIGICE